MTKKGNPTGVDRGARDVEGSERGATGQGTRRQKRACGAGIHDPIGSWVAGQGRQDSKCRTGCGGRRYGSLFGQAVQDRNKEGKSGAKSGAAQFQGGGWEGESVHGG